MPAGKFLQKLDIVSVYNESVVDEQVEIYIALKQPVDEVPELGRMKYTRLNLCSVRLAYWSVFCGAGQSQLTGKLSTTDTNLVYFLLPLAGSSFLLHSILDQLET